MYKINDLKYLDEDIITTDGYLNFCLKHGISYIKTDFFYTGHLNWKGENHPKQINDICVVGHSDYPIIEKISKNFKLIFGVNNNTNCDNTFGIPLGITNYTDESELHSIFGNRKIMIDVFSERKQKVNLCYLNFNVVTHPSERKRVMDLYTTKDWVKKGQIDNSLIGRKKYLEEIRDSKYVLCPRGNGIDTHRLWETLYMGSIPIVKYENTHELFTDLPILFVEEWQEMSEEYLENKYLEIINKKWNLEKLKIDYWTNFIKKTISSD